MPKSANKLNPLDPLPEEIRSMGDAAVEVVAQHFASLAQCPILPDVTPESIRAELDPSLPVEGEDFESLLETITGVIFAGSRQNAHPRMFGYVTSPGTAATAVADLLASALNSNVTAWRSAPAATELERLTLDWIRQIMGMPEGTAGLFVSGGSMANLCGLAAARDSRAQAPITHGGCRELPHALRIYVSEECHHSIAKAAGLLGLGRDNVVHVPVDARMKMDLDRLDSCIRADIAAGHQPCCVVATAGTVNTGAMDDLAGIRRTADFHGLWMHVDASYGGFAALAPSKRGLFEGIELADSVALDPHKWLYVPLDCGCILYRDPARARAVFGHEAEYTRVIGREGDEAFAFWDYGPELSRRFRSLKVWLMLRLAGTRALGEAIERNCACAAYFERLVTESPDFEMLAPVELSIFCFRFRPDGASEEDLDHINEELLIRLQHDGSSYLSNARVNGRFALRGCVLNYRTTNRDMEILLEDVRRAAAMGTQ